MKELYFIEIDYPVKSRTITTGSWSSAKNILFLFFISTLQQCTCVVVVGYKCILQYSMPPWKVLSIYGSIRSVSIKYPTRIYQSSLISWTNNFAIDTRTKHHLLLTMKKTTWFMFCFFCKRTYLKYCLGIFLYCK